MDNTNNTSSTSSTKEKVVVGGAIIGGLICFGFLTNTCKSPISHFDEEVNSSITAVTGNDEALEAQISELEKSNEALKNNSADEKTIADLEAQLYNQRAQAADGLESLKKSNASLQEQIKQLSSAPAASVATPTTAAAATVAAAAMPDAGNEAITSELKAKINDLNAELEVAKMDGVALNKKLSAMSAPSGDNAEAAKLAKDFEFLKKDNKKLADQLTKLKAELKLAKADPESGNAAEMRSKLSDLVTAVEAQKKQIAAKDEQIADLNANVNKLKAAKNVFAKSADDLPLSAQGLLKDLSALEGKSELEVSTAYTQYLKKHNATSKMRVKFASGSASLTAQDRANIALLTQSAGRNTYFLIVGYADQKGSAASNEKLSSARSTSVAKELGINAKANQSTQAVYLGQTDRFGPPTENRVVEIWEIK